MFQRLWEAAKRRPTRALCVAAGVLLIAPWIHLLLLIWALQIMVKEKFPPPGWLVASLNAGQLLWWGCLSAGTILLAWAGYRTYRGKW